MPQFLINLNIQSNLIFRLKRVRVRHFPCASSSTQPCLYFPMLLYNPLLILHRQTCKILVCFDPAVLGGQWPPQPAGCSYVGFETNISMGGRKSIVNSSEKSSEPPESAKINARRDTSARAKTLQNAPPKLRVAFNPAASP
jgi:hypothetical protein